MQAQPALEAALAGGDECAEVLREAVGALDRLAGVARGVFAELEDMVSHDAARATDGEPGTVAPLCAFVIRFLKVRSAADLVLWNNSRLLKLSTRDRLQPVNPS